MFSPSSSPTTTAPAPAPTPTRPSRLRGLSYLRNYTHNHLHLHADPGTASSSPGSLSRSTSYPAQSSSHHSSPRHRSPAVATPSPQRSTNETSTGASPASPSPTSGWLPTVGGLSALSRVATQPQPTSTAPPSAELSGNGNNNAHPNTALSSSMVRNSPTHTSQALPTGNGAAPGGTSSEPPARDDVVQGTSAGAPPAQSTGSQNDSTQAPAQSTALLPSIRLMSHQDGRSLRPSLPFTDIYRTLPTGSSTIRVGRFSEKESNPPNPSNVPSDAPVGFKSKVVSRKHCEFSCVEGQWYIKDVKSSSGTFLNHIRLSQPNQESRPFPLNDGDIVQLGIDFRGGEEMIFRCVKMRVECNRGWQKSLNNFNLSTHKRLRELAKNATKTEGAVPTSECAICLMSIAPCQSLFVAPCSHVWHYKCIRPILNGPTWPQFLCPNCRAVTDLEADVDEQLAYTDWDNEDAVSENAGENQSTTQQQVNGDATGEGDIPAEVDNYEALATMIGVTSITDESGSSNQPDRAVEEEEVDTGLADLENDDVEATEARRAETPLGLVGNGIEHAEARNLSPDPTDILGREGPLTPRNNAGPFVFDGSAGRASGVQLRNLNEATS